MKNAQKNDVTFEFLFQDYLYMDTRDKDKIQLYQFANNKLYVLNI